MSMHEDDAGQMRVSEDNPCPFLRALVANGFVDGGTVPLPKLGGTIEAASGKHGLAARIVGIKTFGVALIANGLNPLRLLRSLVSGAELDHLRNGPLDKHGGGSRILNVDAQVQEDEIARLEGFGSDRPLPGGGTERGLDAGQIQIFMAANLKRDGAQARWYFPFLMKGEWPVLLDIMGKGDGSNRYLSTTEVRTLFVERRFPERITARLMAKPVPGGTIWRIGKAVIGVVGTVVICLIALSLVAALAYV
ncbi:MAG: cytochrome C, partial [Bradyrhizobium sp.]